MHNKTAAIARRLKKAIDAKLEKIPTVVTPEGVVLKMEKSVGGHSGRAANQFGEPVERVKNHTKITKNATQGSVAKIKDFTITEDMKLYIFSDKHIEKGIRDLASTDELIINEFSKRINEANVKNLLREGSNDIITKINDFDATVRVFIKDGNVLSVNGFKGLSARTIGNKICL